MAVANVACPSCAATLQINTPWPAGMLIKCPSCATCFPVPAQEAHAVLAEKPAAERRTAETMSPRRQPLVEDGTREGVHGPLRRSDAAPRPAVALPVAPIAPPVARAEPVAAPAKPAARPSPKHPVAKPAPAPEPDTGNGFAFDTEASFSRQAAGADHEPAPKAAAAKKVARKNKQASNKVLLWSSVGGAAVLIGLVVLLVVAFGGDNKPTAKKPAAAKPSGKATVPETKHGARKEVPANKPAEKNNAGSKRSDANHASGAQAANPVKYGSQFDDWLQDFAKAKQQAEAEKKDVLLLFFASDSSKEATALASEVLGKADFKELTGKSFVPVFLDFPKREEREARVEAPLRNTQIRDQFLVDALPTIIVTDAKGLPYGMVEGYKKGDGKAFVDRLGKLNADRQKRDNLLAAVEKAQGVEKLPAAKDVLQFLEAKKLLPFYDAALEDWIKLAQDHDSKNDLGYIEVFFEADWFNRLARLERSGPSELPKLVEALDEWKTFYKFKDADRAAKLHLMAATLLVIANKFEQAINYAHAGLAYKPTDKDIVEKLTKFQRFFSLGSGTGFVVSADGQILTNYHVIAGKGRIQVYLPGKDPVFAEVVGQDEERDLALIQFKPPDGATLKPLNVPGERMVSRGEKVAAFGYPLGDKVGAGLKLTTGVISGLPEKGNNNMLVLDAKVNPGNSGGPLCDAFGNVVGVVTAKSFSTRTVESYGMALPGQDLDAFLDKYMKGFKPSPALTKPLEWDAVDKLVGPSVVMIVKVP